MADKQRDPVDEKLRAEIFREFQLYDVDGDGYITMREAHRVLEAKLGFTSDKTRRLLMVCDKNGDGRLSYDEFIDFYFRVQAKVRELRSVFNEFDRDGNGHISMEEAKAAFRNLAFNDEEIENLVRAYDANDDGQLQFEEFVKFWNSA